MTQRFCLRWNNHQSNMLSVFDQLLHDESFVDVTLAVDGQLLRAHKMVLSACSPLFQALFIGHPDKHPIVILKDVPYSDMRCLLDFMYRGEVSVDQDRLTAFLKVAESLRIKGLTEVNEEKCDIPSITNNLLSSIPSPHNTPAAQPPPHLHRIQVPHAGQKRTMPPLVASNPLLGSALTAPKRKRGRPRKLSGSSDDPHMRDGSPHELDGELDAEYDSRGNTGSSESLHGSPPPQDMMEMRMDYGHRHNSMSRSGKDDSTNLDDSLSQSPLKDKVVQAQQAQQQQQQQRRRPKDDSEPTPGTSTQETGQAHFRIGSNGNSGTVGSSSTGTVSGSGGGSGGSTGSSGNASSPSNIGNGNGIGLSNSENLPPGLGEMHFGSGLLISPAYAPVAAVLDDTGSSEHEGEMEEVEENEEDAINYSRNSTLLEPLQLKIENMEPKNLVKREMVDKRKPSRPRKIPEQLTISSFGNNSTDVKLPIVTHSEGEMSQAEFDPYEMMNQSSTGYETGEYEQQEGNGKVVPLDVKEGRSVRQFCVREDGNLFRCSICSRTYTHISNFCRHFITTHRGVKQEVPCPICGKLFTRKDNMVTHTKMVHGCSRLDKAIPQQQ